MKFSRKPLVIILISAFIFTYISKKSLYNYFIVNNNTNYKSENIIIVDMGSTGTRMHAYNIQETHNKYQHDHAIPYLTEIAVSISKDSKYAGYYANNPQEIYKHIEPLYNDISNQLENLYIDIKEVPIYYFSTAGLRLHPTEKQANIHTQLLNYTQNKKQHKAKVVAKTIPGSLEGVFDWLSVNYKLQTIQNKTKTIAALDMGGASTQVAVEAVKYKNYKYNYNKQDIKNSNIYTLKFTNKKYNIYSQSLLGYGITQFKANIKNHSQNLKLAEQCLINNKHKKFNFKKCSLLIEQYLDNKKDHISSSKIIDYAVKNNMQIAVQAAYYYNFKFFNSRLLEDLIKQIPDACCVHNTEFKRKNPGLTNTEINNYCLNATYLKVLLNYAFNIPEDYKNLIVPKHDINWTMGAALFIATEQDFSRFE